MGIENQHLIENSGSVRFQMEEEGILQPDKMLTNDKAMKNLPKTDRQ